MPRGPNLRASGCGYADVEGAEVGKAGAIDNGWLFAENPVAMRRKSFPARRLAVLALMGLAGVAAAPRGDEPPATLPPASSQPAAAPPANPVQEENTEREVMIVLKSGQRVTGVLTSVDDKKLVVRISGINAEFRVMDVERYEFLAPLMERYRDLRAAVGNDPQQIVQLAEWLRERGKYELALSEVDRALEINPEHSASLRLKLELESQILLRAQAKTAPKPAVNPRDIPGGGEAPPRKPNAAEFPMFSQSQVDLMKVYEVDLAERPRVIIPREVMERAMTDHAGHPLSPITQEGREAVLRKSPVEQLDLIFRLQARDLYSQVQVLDMPGSIRRFREDVWGTWLMNSCATTMCHGGTDAGRLVLATRRPNHDLTVFTNLYILQKYKTKEGRPLIDWENPEQSVLFQMGLPREDSQFPHPNAPVGATGRDGWKRAFRDTDEKMFRRSVEWAASMYRPRPDYGIPYTPIRPFEDAGPGAAPAGGSKGGRTEPPPR
jgi:hypothetical protein